MQAPTVSRETRTNFSGKKRHPDGKSGKDRNRAARSIKISTDDNGRHHVSFFWVRFNLQQRPLDPTTTTKLGRWRLALDYSLQLSRQRQMKSIRNNRQRNGFSRRNVKQKVNSGSFSCFFLKRHDRSSRIAVNFRNNKQEEAFLPLIGITIGSRVHWMTLKPKLSLGLLPRSFYVWQRLLEYP